jgi:hypothetical protein
MTKSRFQIAKNDIVDYFKSQGNKVYSLLDIYKILDEHRKFWRLPISLKSEDFAESLTVHTQLKLHTFKFPLKTIHRFTWGTVSIYRIASSLEKNAYLSHYSALFMHGLTDQIPKKIYVTHEQPEKAKVNPRISQSNIDSAFQKPSRVSNNIAKYGDISVCLLVGQFSNNLGVIPITDDNGETNQVTNIERTLIDITVRPVYAGGISEVLSAFKRAANRVSINKLNALLKNLDYVYPYHQAIGFYLEKAGNYRDIQVNLLNRIEKKYDFYTDHAMGEVEYSREWKLYYPKGF